MSVTIKDVAKEANVSTSTVSRVLSNSSRISEKTKERVNEVIGKLNYRPNAIARSLASNKTKILGVVLPNESEDLITNSFFIEAMQGMSNYAKKKRYYVTYAFSDNEESELNSIADFISSNLVAGICILRARSNDKIIDYLNETGFPFVIIGRPDESDKMLWVDNDNFEVTYKITQNLINKGYKKIQFIGAQKRWNVSKDRINGFLEACRVNGIKVKDSDIIIERDFSIENGKTAAEKIFKSGNIPEAIVAQDDLIAMGVIDVFKENNRNINIIGFNNSPIMQYRNPKISSVDINGVELGYYATKLLIDRLENKNMKINHYIVKSKIVYRDSFKK